MPAIGYNKNAIRGRSAKKFDDLSSRRSSRCISNEEIATRVIGAMLKEKGGDLKLARHNIKQYVLPALGMNE